MSYPEQAEVEEKLNFEEEKTKIDAATNSVDLRWIAKNIQGRCFTMELFLQIVNMGREYFEDWRVELVVDEEKMKRFEFGKNKRSNRCKMDSFNKKRDFLKKICDALNKKQRELHIESTREKLGRGVWRKAELNRQLTLLDRLGVKNSEEIFRLVRQRLGEIERREKEERTNPETAVEKIEKINDPVVLMQFALMLEKAGLITVKRSLLKLSAWEALPIAHAPRSQEICEALNKQYQLLESKKSKK